MLVVSGLRRKNETKTIVYLSTVNDKILLKLSTANDNLIKL